MRRKILYTLIVFVFICLPAAPAFCVDLPPKAQADLSLLSGMKKYKAADFAAAAEDFAKVNALNVQVGDDFYFYYAKALRQVGKFAQSREAVTTYIAKAGIGSEYYRDALELIVELDEAIEEKSADEQRRRQVAEFILSIPTKTKPHPQFIERLNGMEFHWVGPGCFEMGDKASYGPVHTVCIDGFYMGIHEVTQQQWKIIMGKNPSRFNDCPTCPVENITWADAQAFVKTLNRKSKYHYRLPTEAEWEYAARAEGQQQKFAGAGDINKLAWYNANSGEKSHPVGKKRPNQIGLYDMSGNVWEWCSDFYDENYYKKSPVINPQGPPEGSARVVRGGSWYLWHQFAETTSRHKYKPSYKYGYLGVRLVREHVSVGQ